MADGNEPQHAKAGETIKNLDDLLVRIGQFGSYQRRVVLAVCFVAFSTAFNNLGYVFWAARPYYYCSPSRDTVNHFNGSDEAFLNLTVPWQKDNQGRMIRSRCLQYLQHIEDSESTEGRVDLESWPRYFTEIMHSNYSLERNVTECRSWHYDTRQYKSTIVTEWNLVCSRSWLVSLTQSTYMGGRIIGTLIYGHISDRYGRRVALMTSICLQFVCSFGCCWVSDIFVFLCIRFLLGIQTTGEFQTAFVIVTELVGPSWRVFTGTLIHFYWGIAYMAIAALAYALRERFLLQLALSVPLCLLGILYWVIPETPRWLLAHGKHKELKAVLEKMAEDSDSLKEINAELISNLQSEENTEASRCSLFHLFRKPNIRRTTCILLFAWFVNSFVFYGLSLAASSIGGSNEYLNFFLSGLVEIPAYLTFLFTFTKFGRPLPFAFSMISAGVALISILFVPKELTGVVLALAMIGKAAITCSYAMIYLYTTELYPTVIRSTGIGAGALLARIGGVVAPQAADLRYTWSALPSVIFGGLSLASGLVALILPETRNRPMPQTMNDGEELNRLKCYSKTGNLCNQCP